MTPIRECWSGWTAERGHLAGRRACPARRFPQFPLRAADGLQRVAARRKRQFLWMLLATFLPCITCGVAAPAEELSAAPARQSLLEQAPFDLLILDEASGGTEWKVLPLPERRLPADPDPDASLTVRLVGEEDKQYEVRWRNVRRFRLFEELLLEEAERLTAAGDYDEAFAYYYRLRESEAQFPQVTPSFNRFLYLDAVELTRAQRFAEALAVLEELYRREPRFHYAEGAPTLPEFLDGLVDRMLEALLAQRQYTLARGLLTRIDEYYGLDQPQAAQKWIGRLAALAEDKREEARRLGEAGNYRPATEVVKEMLEIWPAGEGGRALQAELARRYPVVFVGVTQPAVLYEAQRLGNWSARRTGPLVHRALMEFQGAGPEGGRYAFALGTYQHSEDRRRFTLRLDQNDGEFTGYAVSRLLLDMADPRSPRYLASWGGLVDHTTVSGVTQVQVELGRPHVLPEALLRVPLPHRPLGSHAPADGDGPFHVQSNDAQEVRFLAKQFVPGARLAEVVERTYADSRRALADLRSGQIDAIDRLYPADALRLRDGLSTDSPVVVQPYPLPTVHLLIANPRNEYLARRDFRRGLLFAIDRQSILAHELLGSRGSPGCRVLSGPFPASTGEHDPLGYAYDVDIEPRRYAPLLAQVLTSAARNQLVNASATRGAEPPELAPLVLGYPDHEAARVACQAIASHFRAIGVACHLKALPPGMARDPDDLCDLTYTEVAVWEPLVDAARLLGPDGLTGIRDPHLDQALLSLSEAGSWSEVRERLLELHRICHDEVTVLPLWQTVDHFAYHRRLRDVGELPVRLYQNVQQWRLSSGTPE